jgi:effector-binding domain-containing protein
MSCEIHLQHVEPRPIASVRRRATHEQLSKVVPEACGEVWRFLHATHAPHLGLNLAIYWDGEIDLECGVLVPRPFADPDTVTCSQTPGGLVASATHIGPYDRLGETHRAICDWCATEHHRMAGPSWEIYGHWDEDPAKLLTEVFYLLKEGGS